MAQVDTAKLVAMKRVRVIPAPPQDDSRVIVLGVVLWPDRITLHAVVESDVDEIAGDYEGDQATMFQVTDDLGGEYDGPSDGNGSGDTELNVTEWMLNIRPAVAADATKLTVTIWVRNEISGTVEIPL
jgi:hypothetical protein